MRHFARIEQSMRLYEHFLQDVFAVLSVPQNPPRNAVARQSMLTDNVIPIRHVVSLIQSNSDQLSKREAYGFPRKCHGIELAVTFPE